MVNDPCLQIDLVPEPETLKVSLLISKRELLDHRYWPLLRSRTIGRLIVMLDEERDRLLREEKG